MSFPSVPSIAIIGAGLIGLASAWELSRRGAHVTIYEQNWPPRGASWAAAGMLGPAYEAVLEDATPPEFLNLCLKSAELWGRFAEELEAATGILLGYQSGPTLAIAGDERQVRAMDALLGRLAISGVEYEHLSQQDLLAYEPNISRQAAGGLLLKGDGQVDNRRVLQALQKLLGGLVVRGTIDPLKHHDKVLWTTGWQNGYSRAVKGQALALALPELSIDSPIRSRDVYIVPKPDRIVVGATTEPGLSDIRTDDELIDQLHRRAMALYPSLTDCDVLERWAGVRPMTEDRAPVLGRDGEAYVATGHYRNGILLAPVTAKIMADMILEGRVSELAAAFAPQRFAATA